MILLPNGEITTKQGARPSVTNPPTAGGPRMNTRERILSCRSLSQDGSKSKRCAYTVFHVRETRIFTDFLARYSRCCLGPGTYGRYHPRDVGRQCRFAGDCTSPRVGAGCTNPT